MRKKQLDKYISILEEVRDSHPEVADKVGKVIDSMLEDYGKTLKRELVRQKDKRLEAANKILGTDEYNKIENLHITQFIVVGPADKQKYRTAKCAVAAHNPDRKFSMRFVKGVGMLLTRIQ